MAEWSNSSSGLLYHEVKVYRAHEGKTAFLALTLGEG